MTLRKVLMSSVMVAAVSLFAGAAFAEDAQQPAAQPAVQDQQQPAADDQAAAEEEDEPELTYQQQASALIDTVIEDYTVRMAALQAIIDMKDDEIAGNQDNIKKINDANKKLTTAVKTAKSVSKSLRAVITALPDTDANKADAIAALDRLDAAIAKTEAQ